MKKTVATIHYWAGQYEALTYIEGRRTILAHGADKNVLAASLRKEYKVVVSQTNSLFTR